MESKTNSRLNNEKSNEVKQVFLSNAISDIATYIQLADTKVSIIMGSLAALIAGVFSCYEPIFEVFSNIKPCSWIGISIIIFTLSWLHSTSFNTFTGILRFLYYFYCRKST